MSEPYKVELESVGCDHCGAGGVWGVCFTPDDCFESTFYDNKEHAQDVADMLNAAFKKGTAAVPADLLKEVIGLREQVELLRATDRGDVQALEGELTREQKLQAELDNERLKSSDATQAYELCLANYKAALEPLTEEECDFIHLPSPITLLNLFNEFLERRKRRIEHPA